MGVLDMKMFENHWYGPGIIMSVIRFKINCFVAMEFDFRIQNFIHIASDNNLTYLMQYDAGCLAITHVLKYILILIITYRFGLLHYCWTMDIPVFVTCIQESGNCIQWLLFDVCKSFIDSLKEGGLHSFNTRVLLGLPGKQPF